MIHILDTCTFIWLCSEPSLLSRAARQLIDDPRNDPALSDVSVMEITMKWSAGRIELPDPPRIWIEAQTQTWNLTALVLTREDIYRSGELPEHHRDPFDRLLVGSALNHNATIITPDAAIRKYPVSSAW